MENKELLLTIDPGVKKTSFCMWRKNNKNWEPINTFSIKDNFDILEKFRSEKNLKTFIERGFYSPINRSSSEQMETLRGNIFGLLGKTYNPNCDGVAPMSWQTFSKRYLNMKWKEPWTKFKSVDLANDLILANNWKLEKIKDHNIAEALLIGWFIIKNNFKNKIGGK